MDLDVKGLYKFSYDLKNGKKTYNICSKSESNRPVPYIDEAHISSLGFGFIGHKVEIGDTVELELDPQLKKGSCYIALINIFVPVTPYVEFGTKIEICYGKDCHYEANTSDMQGILNQILMPIKYDEGARLIIRLIAEKSVVKNYIGMISVKGICFSEVKEISHYKTYSTLELLRERRM